MLTSETTINHKVIKHTVTFDTDKIPLELIELDFQQFIKKLSNIGLYNANKNNSFIYIRTDPIIVIKSLYSMLTEVKEFLLYQLNVKILEILCIVFVIVMI